MKTTPTPKITDPEKTISEILQKPADELNRLKSFLADCQKRQADPDPRINIPAEMEAERAQARINDFERRPIDLRASQLLGEWFVENVAELAERQKAELAERTKNRANIFEVIGSKAAAVTARIFSAPTPLEAERLEAERTAIEAQAAEVEASIAAAKMSIRFFEINPDLQTFRAAEARVNEVLSMGSAGSSAIA